jgi:uncharacterized protein
MDVMRGIAVLGILLMNIMVFGVNDFYLSWNDAIAGHLTVNGFIYKSTVLLSEGRMRGLFTLLFGAGIMLFIENKRSNSIQVADAYFRRMTWLLLFGLFDAYVLLWKGDILFEYALCGIFIYVLRNLRVRYMLLISFISIGAYTYVEGKGFNEFKTEVSEYLRTEELLKQGKTLSEEDQSKHDEWEYELGGYVPFSDTVLKNINSQTAADLKLHRSGYADIWENHSKEAYEYHSTVFFSIFGETFGTVLLGMALFKLGFFHGRLKLKTYWLMCVIGIVVGLGLVALYMKLQVRSKGEFWEVYYSWRNFSREYFMQTGRILCTLGYAALIYLLCQAHVLKKFLNLFSNVGRMAFTNYIMQTILCSFYFFGFGLGHFGEYHAKGLFLFVVCIWIIQIVYSNIYLHYFQMGPLEWLWKRLTYGKLVSERAQQ